MDIETERMRRHARVGRMVLEDGATNPNDLVRWHSLRGAVQLSVREQ